MLHKVHKRLSGAAVSMMTAGLVFGGVLVATCAGER